MYNPLDSLPQGNVNYLIIGHYYIINEKRFWKSEEKHRFRRAEIHRYHPHCVDLSKSQQSFP